jgi:DNA repair protein RecO
MYEIVVTDGLVLGKRFVREADALVQIFTPGGLLRARATSVRSEKSKLRYGLEPLTQARFSLVRGRHEWRLTGVEAVSRQHVANAPGQRQAMARVARLLMRLIHGQEASAALYTTVIEGFKALAHSDSPDTVEVVLVLRILSHLGYLPHTEALAPFIDGQFDVELSAKALESRGLLIRTINESLQATSL